MLIVALLLAAAASPYLERSVETSNALVLVDISESMSHALSDSLLRTVDRFEKEGLKISVLPFGGRPAENTLPFSDVSAFIKLQGAWAKLNIGQTNLEAALAAAVAGSDTNILLISDGFQNSGSTERLLALLKRSRSRVYPLAPGYNSGKNSAFRITQLHAPLVAPANQSVEIRTSIQNTTRREQSGKLQIKHDGKKVLAADISLKPGQEILVLSESDPSSEGIKKIVATLTPFEKRSHPSSAITYLSGEERERIYMAAGDSSDLRVFEESLQEQSYRLVTEIPDAERITLPDLKKFSVVVFNNIALRQLEKTAVKKIEKYVKRGGSFIMLGGNRSFGLGGYLDTRMEEILPVRMLPPQTIKKRLNVAVALVLDKSRSMLFGSKIEFAKDAAREVIRNLKPDDYVTVIGFDTTPFVAVPIMQIRDNRDRALGRVSRLFPAGKTNLFPAVDEGRRSLLRVKAGRKHMIILTDGKIPDAGPYYLELVRQMRLEGVSVSTVMMGREADVSMLKEMANIGGGAFYQTSNAQSLPRIFLADIHASTGERTMREREEYLVKTGPDRLRSTAITSFPPVRGFVQTARKKNADLELITMDLGKAAPLLASWQYGKGKSVAFTSDVNGRWSSYWIRWPKFQRFWTEVIDSLRPKNVKEADQETIQFQLNHFMEQGSLVLELSIFTEGVSGNVISELTGPDGSTSNITLTPVSVGRYRAVVEDAMAGKYQVKTYIGERTLTPVAFHLSGELFGERKGAGFDLAFLSKIASISGGKINPEVTDVTDQVYTQIEKDDVSHWFFLTALILLIVEILSRELPQGILRTVLTSIRRLVSWRPMRPGRI